MEVIARHNISSGKKGERKLIRAGERFDPADYPEISENEWRAMAQNGTIYPPDDPSYAPQTALQRQAAAAEVGEGRSPRTDLGANAPARTEGGITRPARPAREEDDDDEDEPPARQRRVRRRAAEDDDDEV